LFGLNQESNGQLQNDSNRTKLRIATEMYRSLIDIKIQKQRSQGIKKTKKCITNDLTNNNDE
jgi:hypothetical protein